VALTAVKTFVRRAVRRAGYELVPTARPDLKYLAPSHSDDVALPQGAGAELRLDNPRLVALRDRYRRCELPMADRTMWQPSYLDDEVELAYFRGDNSYVWQFRNIGDEARRTYYLYLRDVEARDRAGLLDRLTEDGAFGCWTFDYPGHPMVSRDLLDSINEIYFLDEHVGLLDARDWTVLDIGAGYGRLAHRLLAAVPGIGSYLCVDGVPESTFLCDYYLRFRGVDERAEVVPLDELTTRLCERHVDLAINIHSFSEMSTSAIAAWLDVVRRSGAQWLLVVPNDNDRLLSFEAGGTRREFGPLMEEHGYELAVRAPIFADVTMGEMTGMRYHFFLYRRSA